ncbi:MAG: zf-HC2 domain-containing protein [candidate division WOR-3 bacterium]|nr:zf-HC2 domain-containing protein [candidate division WOR-3 bacterium]
MKNCKKQDWIIAYIEDLMPKEQRILFEQHLKECALCQRELFEYQKIYNVLKKDEIILPEPEFFEKLKEKIRKEEITIKRSSRKLLGVLAPVMGVLIFIVLLHLKKESYVEFSISVSPLVLDENLSSLLLDEIVDDKLLGQFKILDEYINDESTQAIMEMTSDEKAEFIKILYNKFGIEYLQLRG